MKMKKNIEDWLNSKTLFCGCISPKEFIKGICDKEGAHADDEFCKKIEKIDGHFIGVGELRLRHIILFYLAYYVVYIINNHLEENESVSNVA